MSDTNPIDADRARPWGAAFFALLAIAAAARLVALLHFPNIMSTEGEEYSKLQLFMQWIANDNLYPDTNFGPLHMLLFWPTAKLFGHAAMPNRVVTLLLALATFFPLHALVRRIAGDTAALAAMALAALSSLLIIIGVNTLAEGPCLFFLMCALALFARMIDRREVWRWRDAALFAACASAAGALRYEVWMYLPLWPIWLLVRRGFVRAAATGAMLAVFPIIHMAVTWKVSGHPLNFVLVSAATTSINAAVTPWDERALLWVQALARIEGWWLFGAAVLGVVYAFVTGRARFAAILYAYYFAVVEIQALRAAMAPELHRYATFLVALSFPPIAAMLADAAGRVIRPARFAQVAAIVTALALAASSLFYFEHVEQETHFFDESFEIARRLRVAMSDGDRVFLGKESHPLIAVESGFDWHHFRVPQYRHGEAADPDSVARIFAEWRPTLVLATRHDPTFLSSAPVRFCEDTELFGRVYSPVTAHGSWCLLRENGAAGEGP